MAQDLHDFKLSDLYSAVALPEEEFKRWMVAQGLLHGSMNCPKCHQPMILEQGSGREVIWRCNRRIHRPENPKVGFKVSLYILLSYFIFIGWHVF